jgi:hypothetical protein
MRSEGWEAGRRRSLRQILPVPRMAMLWIAGAYLQVERRAGPVKLSRKLRGWHAHYGSPLCHAVIATSVPFYTLWCALG